MPRGSSSRGTVTLRNEGSNTQREVRDAREICYVAGFVPQDDIVCADLTIRWVGAGGRPSAAAWSAGR